MGQLQWVCLVSVGDLGVNHPGPVGSALMPTYVPTGRVAELPEHARRVAEKELKVTSY